MTTNPPYAPFTIGIVKANCGAAEPSVACEKSVIL
jgi:hypothetical protein